MLLKMITGALSLMALVACTSPAPAPSAPSSPTAPVAGACNAQGAQFAVGKQAGASVVEDARQRSGSYMARVLRPGQAVTMEFNAQRLNLDVDGAGVVTRVRCG
ncbi:MAG: I78 family peptidase inhibitor [Polaromonas sp.]|nr:I78 family peptidase inhibitor [Polaromonas sp.]